MTKDVFVIDRAAFNQGANALYSITVEVQETMPCLVAQGPHAVAYEVPVTTPKRDVFVLDRAATNQGVNAKYPFIAEVQETMPTLLATGPHSIAYDINAELVNDDE